MRKKDKKQLLKIIIAAVALISVTLIDRFDLIPKLLYLNGFDLQALLLYMIPYLIVGGSVLMRAARGILHGQMFDENFLMSIATIGAFAIGEYSEAVFVMLFYSVGELFEHVAVNKSRGSIKALLSIRADTAFVESDDGELVEIPCEQIKIGDVICVKPGGKIALDGEIIEGSTSINTVALTGESLPRDVKEGDVVLSGCVNMQGFIKIKVTKLFGDSTVSKILQLVESSVENKSKSENFITKFARFYTPAVVGAAALLAILPPLIIGADSLSVWKEWIGRAMTFLVISCPCALVISVPLSYFGGIGSASSKGILVKGSSYLDALAKCDTVVFDKTGTLTEGNFTVTDIKTENGIDRAKMLALASAAEKYSTHPISLAIITAANAEICATEHEATEIKEVSGRGVKALVDEKLLLVGNADLMRENNVFLPSDTIAERGVTIHVAHGGEYLGAIIVSDRPKAKASSALAKLRKLGVKKTVMLTGDRAAEAKLTAAELGIDEYHAELLPADKVTAIENLLRESKNGANVAFVGDGINDAPVLARADVGIAMGALGSDAAIEAADVVLMNDDLDRIGDAILLAKKTRRIVIQNIVFALGVKAAVLALGAFGLVGLNAAVFADVGVAVIAILNSMRALR
ncbi:MAG: cadmium-translocating P-type ATPase [Clostridia bacterium]|nr:cadmium-translocating P-type ATPase [Clostridia bacterium]